MQHAAEIVLGHVLEHAGGLEQQAHALHLREPALASAGLRDEQARAHDGLRQATAVEVVEHLPHGGHRARIEARLPADRGALVRHLQRHHVPVDLEERRLARGVAQVAPQVERRRDDRGAQALGAPSRVAFGARLAPRARHRRRRRHAGEERIAVRQHPALRAQRMELAQHPREPFGHRIADGRSHEQFVGALGEFRERGHRLERLLVDAVVLLQLLQRLERALVQRHVVGDLAVGVLDLVDLHPVETRRQRLDVLEHFEDLRVLLLRDLARHEDAEVPDVLVDEADDRLAVGLDLVGRRVEVRDPVERLLRRGDVVAHRREHDDRLLDRLQVEVAAGAEPGLALRELVADEQVVDDPADLLLVQQVEPSPPALELEEARRLVVDVVVEVVVLVPDRVRRVERLEV